MADLFITFMKKHIHYELSCGNFYHVFGTVVLCLGEEESLFIIEDSAKLYEMIYDMDLPFRICMTCGKPFEEGFTDDYGDTYFCSFEEFADDMDSRYGKGNWRAEPTGKRDWCYEYRESNGLEFLPEPSFYTEWY